MVTPSLADVLRSTLEHLEQTEENSPALRELKRTLILSIADIERQKSKTAEPVNCSGSASKASVRHSPIKDVMH